MVRTIHETSRLYHNRFLIPGKLSYPAMLLSWILQLSLYYENSFLWLAEILASFNHSLGKGICIWYKGKKYSCPCAYFIKHHEIKMYGKWRSVPCIINLSNRWICVVFFMSQGALIRTEDVNGSTSEPVWMHWTRENPLACAGNWILIPWPSSS